MDTTTIAEVATIVLLGVLLVGVIKIKTAKKSADNPTLLQDRAANEPLTLAESIRAKIEAQKEKDK